MGLRILSALILIAAVTAAVFFTAPLIFSVLVVLLCLVCHYEFLKLGPPAGPAGVQRAILSAGAVAGFSMIYPWMAWHREAGLTGYFLILAGLSLLTSRRVEDIQARLVWPAAGFLYIYLLFSYVFDIRFAAHPEHGAWLLMFFLVFQWAGDSAALFSGMACGRHKLAPLFSPKKTVEGAIGGLAATVLTGGILGWWLYPDRPLWPFLLLGAVLSAAGQAGDLIESQFKRAAGVKDSGSIVPGHGGLLDRMDSLLPTAPLFFFGIRWITG